MCASYSCPAMSTTLSDMSGHLRNCLRFVYVAQHLQNHTTKQNARLMWNRLNWFASFFLAPANAGFLFMRLLWPCLQAAYCTLVQYIYPLPWTPEFRTDLAQNLMQPFPHPNDGSDKISLRLAHWLQRYSSLKMFTDTHTQTTARLVYYKLTFEPSAQVS